MDRMLMIAAFNYLVYILALQFAENDDESLKEKPIKEKLDYFNLNNDFGLKKLDLFPFILTIGNGQRLALMKHYGYRFSPVTHGIVQKDIFKYLREKRISPTADDFFSFDAFSCKALETSFISKDEIATAIYDKFAHANSLDKAEFDTAILKLQESLKYINERKIKKIANADFSLLSYWSTEGIIYNIYKAFYDEKTADVRENHVPLDITFNRSIAVADFRLANKG